MNKLNSTRREYGQRELRKNQVSSDPYQQFTVWFEEAIAVVALDPNAMVFATIDEKGFPDARVVLLKGMDSQGFVFFTHYSSPKGMQVAQNNHVALNFYWRELARQVRIKGLIEKISRQESDVYFHSRPRQSQICTVASHQSEVVANRKVLDTLVQTIENQYKDKDIPCPNTWGGYRVIPLEFEFFQGRDNRLNDRIRYLKVDNNWHIDRLSP
jgi:pyridoxamine 5'-phosphate oxidase